MNKLLVLGSVIGSKELVELAKAQGIYTIVTDYLTLEESTAKQVADEYWMISTAEVDVLAEKCRENGITAVICGVSEFNISRSIELAKKLDLPFYCTEEAWKITSNKYHFKEACRRYDVPVAQDYFLSNPPTEEELDAIVFPVVVKAVDLCANRGMSYCYNKEDVVKACAYARSMSKSEQVITERMLHGREYEAHYLLADGDASLTCFAAMLPQPGYPENCYGVTTTATDHLQRFLREVDPSFKQLLKKTGCTDGAAWLEMMLDDDGHFYVLEMGHRMSGDLIELAIDEAIGFDTLQWMLDCSLGKKHIAQQLPESLIKLPEKHIFSYILWSKREGIVTKVEGVEEIEKIPGVRITCNSEVGESFRQYKYMFAVTYTGEDPEEMISLVKRINRTVKMEDENGENFLLYYDDFATMRRIYEEGKNEEMNVAVFGIDRKYGKNQ